MSAKISVIVLIAVSSVLYSQNTTNNRIHIQLQDSFYISTITNQNFGTPYLIKNNHNIFQATGSPFKVYILRHDVLNQVRETVYKDSFPNSSVCIITSHKGISFFVTAKKSMYIYDTENNMIKTVKLSEGSITLYDKNTRYKANIYGSYSTSGKLTDKGILFIPIYLIRKIPLSPDNKFVIRKQKKLLGIYKIENHTVKPLGTVGYADSLNSSLNFKHISYNLYKTIFDIDTVQNRIFVLPPFSHKIQVWNFEKQEIEKTFGSFSQRIPYNSIIPKPLKYNKKQKYSIELMQAIETSTYEGVNYDYKNKLIFVTYKIAQKDTTRHLMASGKEWRKFRYKKLKLILTRKNACINIQGKSEIVRKQVSINQSKPYGLQIYNENYELVYDEIMPTPFNILKTENNEIWVHGRYDEANQKYWIYRYKIELSKP